MGPCLTAQTTHARTRRRFLVVGCRAVYQSLRIARLLPGWGLLGCLLFNAPVVIHLKTQSLRLAIRVVCRQVISGGSLTQLDRTVADERC